MSVVHNTWKCMLFFFEKGMACLKKAMTMLACHSATTGVKTFLSQSRVYFSGKLLKIERLSIPGNLLLSTGNIAK